MSNCFSWKTKVLALVFYVTHCRVVMSLLQTGLCSTQQRLAKRHFAAIGLYASPDIQTDLQRMMAYGIVNLIHCLGRRYANVRISSMGARFNR